MISLWHSHVDFQRLIIFRGFILIAILASVQKYAMKIRIQFCCVSSRRFIFERATWDCANSKTRIYTHIIMVFARFFFLPHTVFSRTSSHLHSLFSLIFSRLPPTSKSQVFVKIFFSCINSNEIPLSFYVHNKPLMINISIIRNNNSVFMWKRGNYACDFILYVLLSTREGEMMTRRWAGDKSKK